MAARGPNSEWRRALDAFPPAERTPTQTALARTQVLLDRLVDTFAHPTRPPPPSDSPEARDAVITALEGYKYSFKGTYSFPLLPPELWQIVGPQGAIQAVADWVNTHIECLEDPMLQLDPATAEAAPERFVETLCMAISFGLWFFDYRDPNRYDDRLVDALAAAEEVIEALGRHPAGAAAVEAALASGDHQITLLDLRSIALQTRTSLLCNKCTGERISPAAYTAWEEWEAVALAEGPANWILLDNYNAIVNPIVEMTDIDKGCAMGLAARILKKAMKSAEAEGDPFRLAWACYDLGRTLATGTFDYHSMCVLEEKARAAAEQCRAWAPRRLRDAAFGSSKDVEEVLEFVRASSPQAQIQRERGMSYTLQLGNYPRYWRTYHAELDPSVHKMCAACGRRGPDLLRCSRCKSVTYCNVECQKNHFPEHKKDCRRLAEERAQRAAAE